MSPGTATSYERTRTSPVRSRLLRIAVVAANLVVTVYVAVMQWLMNVWPLDDGRAARMTDRDWQLGAAFREVDAVVIALLLAGGLYAANWAAARYADAIPRPWVGRLALAAGATAWAAGTAGAIQFLVEKPWF